MSRSAARRPTWSPRRPSATAQFVEWKHSGGAPAPLPGCQRVEAQELDVHARRLRRRHRAVQQGPDRQRPALQDHLDATTPRTRAPSCRPSWTRDSRDAAKQGAKPVERPLRLVGRTWRRRERRARPRPRTSSGAGSGPPPRGARRPSPPRARAARAPRPSASGAVSPAGAPRAGAGRGAPLSRSSAAMSRSAPVSSVSRPARSRAPASGWAAAVCSSTRTRTSVGSDGRRPLGCARSRTSDTSRRVAVHRASEAARIAADREVHLSAGWAGEIARRSRMPLRDAFGERAQLRGRLRRQTRSSASGP